MKAFDPRDARILRPDPEELPWELLLDADPSRARVAGYLSDELTRVAAVAVNGVLVNYKRGMKTPVRDGDTVAFVKAAAGG